MNHPPIQLRLPSEADSPSPGCPFHPARSLGSTDTRTSLRSQHVRLKPGLDYLRLTSPSGAQTAPAEIDFGEERLVLGYLHMGGGSIRAGRENSGIAEVGKWFRFSESGMRLVPTGAEPMQTDLFLCSRDLAGRLQVFEADASGTGLRTFASGGKRLPFHCGPMNVETMDAAQRIARADLRSFKHRLRLEAGILCWIAEVLAQGEDAGNEPPSSINAADREVLDRIVRQFHHDPGRDYSLAEICKRAGMNENKLKSAFKQLHGRTVFNFLRAVRMEQAGRLLREDRASVIQVANEVGYSNPSHFARAFKDHHGLLPKAFQCLHRSRADHRFQHSTEDRKAYAR
ncbi:MAG: helix-turn-helix transcriptional regulator [Verrucomicrobiota bacterium]